MMHANLDHLLSHPGLLQVLRRDDADGPVLMALVADGAAKVLILHFASAKLQKLYFRVEKSCGLKPTSGDDVARSVGICMLMCEGKVEGTLTAGTVGAIDGNSWSAVALSTAFPPQFRSAMLGTQTPAASKMNGHLRLVSSGEP